MTADLAAEVLAALASRFAIVDFGTTRQPTARRTAVLRIVTT
jgi:hypothetical protein